MIERIDHVSLAVRDRAAALRFFVEVLGGREVWSEPAAPAGFHWTLIELGDSCLLELIDPLGDRSFLERFFERRGDGAHHVTFQVDDLEVMARRLEARGVPFFGQGEPYPGWKELFVHPKHAHGVLLQFAEFDPLQWVQEGAEPPAPYRRLAEARQKAAAASLLLLGDPRLRRVCLPVQDPTDDRIRQELRQMEATLSDLRRAPSSGRAIAAPQLGLEHRLVVADLGEGPTALINPELTPLERAGTFTLWDDCLSCPDLLVRLERHASVSVRFLDEQSREQRWTELDRATSELLQHEVDHLDGILTLDRALDRESVICRQVYEEQRAHFDSLVDKERS